MEQKQAEAAPSADSDAWRGELAQRLQTYRARRRKVAPNLAQSQLPFEQPAQQPPSRAAAMARAGEPLRRPGNVVLRIRRHEAPQDAQMVRH